MTAGRKGFDTSPETWGTALTTTKGCTGGTESAATGGTADETACKGKCTAKKASAVDANSVPTTGGTGADYCFGYAWKASATECKLITANLSALAAASGADNGITC